MPFTAYLIASQDTHTLFRLWSGCHSTRSHYAHDFRLTQCAADSPSGN